MIQFYQPFARNEGTFRLRALLGLSYTTLPDLKVMHDVYYAPEPIADTLAWIDEFEFMLNGGIFRRYKEVFH